MIPLRDDAPRFSYPGVTLVLILVNVAVFLYQVSLAVAGPEAHQVFVETYGAIPLRTAHALAGRYPFVDGVAPIFTSIFLHGGWFHLIGNMWFLWIFGDNIEDELGHFPYLVFYIACGLAASLAHFFANPTSTVPAVGASGAIAGVMGAYLVRFPWARIVTLIPIFFFFTTVEIPAVLMLFYWFLIQFVSGAATFGQSSMGGVAWWAHIGGFVTGAALIWSRPRRRRLRRPYYY
jgi:membrane associated rhomboid family serine protease